jgi:23S rRNA (cytidine1920-2'-O)/16S rRNA (cytidine1409-2'-O)-methyltransferase
VRGFFPSGLPGPKGNIETFVALAEHDRGSLTDLDALAFAADPA